MNISRIIDDINVGLRANNGGGLEFDEKLCRCDASMNHICEYCAIDSALRRAKKFIIKSKLSELLEFLEENSWAVESLKPELEKLFKKTLGVASQLQSDAQKEKEL